MKIAICAGALFAGAMTAHATPVTFLGFQGDLAASATFDVSGSDLVVSLSNTSLVDVQVPADVLTAIFFDVTGSALSLTAVSAVVPNTSTVFFGTTEPGGGVGGEFAYKSGLVGAPHGADYGISSSGLTGLFGPSDRFPGVNLSGTSSPNGLDYGITSLGDLPGTGNSAVTGGQGPLIKNEVVFHLSGLPAGFDPSTRITNVSFQYGTGLTEPNIPEPASLVLLGVAGLAGMRRRR